MDLDALTAAQAARWQAVDPLLPTPRALDPAGRLLTASAGASDAAGTALSHRTDPGSLAASWDALRQHVLVARVAGPDPAAALGALLDRWEDEVGADVEPGDEDTSLEITWPSRDTTPVLALVRRGFAPTMSVAVARTGGPPAEPVPGLTVRPVGSTDIEAATALNLELLHFDAQFGTVTMRASSAARLADKLRSQLGRNRERTWLAERDGRAVGLCAVELPADLEWLGRMCAAGPVGYLSVLVVGAAERSAGVGSMLAARADTALHAAGAAVTLLHHAVANPVSTPFWHRHGYRPLWTTWQRRPAVRKQPGRRGTSWRGLLQVAPFPKKMRSDRRHDRGPEWSPDPTERL